MLGDALQKRGKCSWFEWAVRGDDLVMLATYLGGNADMRTLLTGYLIAEHPQCLCKHGTIDVPGQFHTAMSSSLTKCSLITDGRSDAPSK